MIICLDLWLCITCVQYLQRPEEGVGSLEQDILWVLGLDQGPLEKQPVPLTTKPFLPLCEVRLFNSLPPGYRCMGRIEINTGTVTSPPTPTPALSPMFLPLPIDSRRGVLATQEPWGKGSWDGYRMAFPKEPFQSSTEELRIQIRRKAESFA